MGRWWVGAAGIALVGCGELREGPLPPEELAQYASCEAPADCVVVENGCCCEMVAVNRDDRATFREQFTCGGACECDPRPMRVDCRSGMCRLLLGPADPP